LQYVNRVPKVVVWVISVVGSDRQTEKLERLCGISQQFREQTYPVSAGAAKHQKLFPKCPRVTLTGRNLELIKNGHVFEHHKHHVQKLVMVKLLRIKIPRGNRRVEFSFAILAEKAWVIRQRNIKLCTIVSSNNIRKTPGHSCTARAKTSEEESKDMTVEHQTTRNQQKKKKNQRGKAHTCSTKWILALLE
jgi:hypothetical protein